MSKKALIFGEYQWTKQRQGYLVIFLFDQHYVVNTNIIVFVESVVV